MPTIFEITADNKPVPLVDGAGEITITVTNTTDKPFRGLAKIQPRPPTQADWLEIRGEKERNFGPKASDSFVVKMTAPGGAVPGKFPFRLYMWDTRHPDVFDEGPEVSFELPKTIPGPDPDWKIWPYIVAAAVFLVCGGLTWWLLASKSASQGTYESTRVIISNGTNQTITAKYLIHLNRKGQTLGGFVLQDAQVPKNADWSDFESILSRLRQTTGQVAISTSNIPQISHWPAMETFGNEIQDVVNRTQKSTNAASTSPEARRALQEQLDAFGPALWMMLIKLEANFDVATIFSTIPAGEKPSAPSFYLQSGGLTTTIKVQDEHSGPDSKTRTFSVLRQSARNKPFDKIGEVSYFRSSGLLQKLDVTIPIPGSDLKIIVERL